MVRLGEAKAIFESLVLTNALQPLGDYAIEAHAHLGFIAARIGDTTTALAVDRWLADLRTPYILGQNTELRGALHALLGHGDEAVRLLHQAMGALFREGGDALEVVKWKDLYDKVEDALDRCEDVGNVLQSIAIKNA